MDLSGTQWHLSATNCFLKGVGSSVGSKAPATNGLCLGGTEPVPVQSRLHDHPVQVQRRGECQGRWLSLSHQPVRSSSALWFSLSAKHDQNHLPQTTQHLRRTSSCPSPVCSQLASRIVASVPCFSRLLQVPSRVDFVLDANGKCGIGRHLIQPSLVSCSSK